jgi:sugar phosphate isomerase/epimerase
MESMNVNTHIRQDLGDFKKSYKHQFPFKLATTSFIYRDTYAANVERLGRIFDEIELLFFDGQDPRGLPDLSEIEDLVNLARVHGITYNVHLPTDVSLTDPEPERVFRAVDVIGRVVERVKPLSPTSYTLHLPSPPSPLSNDELNEQRALTEKAVTTLLHGTKISPPELCVENTEDPFFFAAPIIEALGLSTCLDIGHLIRYGHDMDAVFSKWIPHSKVIHLHGVSDGRDHQALDAFEKPFLKDIFERLLHFKGTVCLEVFSLDTLLPSLSALEDSVNQFRF